MSPGANGAQDATPLVSDEFDLDALEREVTHEPFRFRVGGEHFAVCHPDELDWHDQDDLDSENLGRIFRALLGDEQFARFAPLHIESWKLERLMKAWGEYFGITIPESSASSTSSAITARPSRPISAPTTASASQTSPAAD